MGSHILSENFFEVDRSVLFHSLVFSINSLRFIFLLSCITNQNLDLKMIRYGWTVVFVVL